MKTLNLTYDEVKVGDLIFTNGKDNHMFRKLKFNEVETVVEVEKYESKGNGPLVLVKFESLNSTLGFPNRELEKIIE